MKLPIVTRYKQADSRWSPAVHADTLEQAREHVRQYRQNGYTEIDIVDADGYPSVRMPWAAENSSRVT
jgi:hypothetical protein